MTKITILELRRFVGLSQSAMGERLGVDQPAVARLEKRLASGKVHVETLARYLDALHVEWRLDVDAGPEKFHLLLFTGAAREPREKKADWEGPTKRPTLKGAK